ncbi:MAG: EAL domain-containing protein [Lachnospiraceae bacterium]|nr:EAL domain-containing protein [Lachnospiraceae bacterium]
METDKLTGLLLFDGFLDFAKDYLAKSNTDDHIAIISTDLSKFKYINRVYGFTSGDKLIRKLAELFMGREECVAACRPYSDHIVGLFNLKDKDVRECVECVRLLQNSFVAENKADYSKASIHLNTGIYEIVDRKEEISSALDKANIARRSVKGNYSVPCAIYTKEMQERREGDEKIIPLFEKAVEERSILVYFQPKVSVSEHCVVGAEALTRLQNEDGSIIPPDVFIPVLESSGKILELDWYVMRFVFSKIRDWLDEGKKPQKISVNLSKIHFYYDTLVDDIIREFEKHQISPEYVEFEITESVFFEEADLIISKIERLREYGFKVSVDDFGAGYSSLNLIGILPVDIIKLDKRFVKNSLGNKKGKDIIKGLISILNEIDMDIVCEGIETKEEERIVYEFGCDSMQGYLYDRPIPVSDYEKKYIY